jgi:hypothetical protein
MLGMRMLLLLESGSDLCDILQIIVNQVLLGFQGNLHCLQARIGPEEKQKNRFVSNKWGQAIP